MEAADLNANCGRSRRTASTRISPRIHLEWQPFANDASIEACAALGLGCWKNLNQKRRRRYGRLRTHIEVSTGAGPLNAFIEVADTGKRISRKNFKTVFNPGFTTKSRGWGPRADTG